MSLPYITCNHFNQISVINMYTSPSINGMHFSKQFDITFTFSLNLPIFCIISWLPYPLKFWIIAIILFSNQCNHLQRSYGISNHKNCNLKNAVCIRSRSSHKCYIKKKNIKKSTLKSYFFMLFFILLHFSVHALWSAIFYSCVFFNAILNNSLKVSYMHYLVR